MKNLYFAFAILALPLAAFAEAGDSMINHTSQKQIDTTKGPQHNDYRCADNSNEVKCTDNKQQEQKEMFENNKQNSRERKEVAAPVNTDQG